MKKIQKYQFQNIYAILTYKCNMDCAFCLFRYSKERECNMSIFSDRLEYSIINSKKKVYVKITGGEPFLKPKLLKSLFNICHKHRNKIHAIGIGTNGTIKIPSFFDTVDIRTDIFLSRHTINNNTFIPKNLYSGINKNIEFRLNCNLIKNGVDSVDKIKKYLDVMCKLYSIKYVCFRELNKVNVDYNLMYPRQIYDYQKYYNKNIVSINKIENEITKDRNFVKTKINGNSYDYNSWYWYKNNNIGVKFRKIDEKALIRYNNSFSGIDEYVIHPDGTLTGCWDKELKPLKKGV